jgi:hypothetical protein
VAGSLARIFAVREIVAIEAKIREWSEAIAQARLNTWFASRSFVLVPSVPRRSQLLAEAESSAVGVFSRGPGMSPVVREANRFGLPRSYASWLFNEWVWRSSRVEA